jgi:hypothetical protein
MVVRKRHLAKAVSEHNPKLRQRKLYTQTENAVLLLRVQSDAYVEGEGETAADMDTSCQLKKIRHKQIF